MNRSANLEPSTAKGEKAMRYHLVKLGPDKYSSIWIVSNPEEVKSAYDSKFQELRSDLFDGDEPSDALLRAMRRKGRRKVYEDAINAAYDAAKKPIEMIRGQGGFYYDKEDVCKLLPSMSEQDRLEVFALMMEDDEEDRDSDLYQCIEKGRSIEEHVHNLKPELFPILPELRALLQRVLDLIEQDAPQC